MAKRLSSAVIICAVAVALVLVVDVCSGAGGELIRGRRAAPKKKTAAVKAVYVFGDSLVDVGNKRPPGIADGAQGDFSLRNGLPRGRFTNGYNLADTVARRLGFKMSPPPYKSFQPENERDLQDVMCRIGANFASGGSGILDTTGNGVLTLQTQVQDFVELANKMYCSRGNKRHLSRAGGNDFSAFLTNPDSSITDASAYISTMVSTYLSHIYTLYAAGAHMVGILDVPPIGCTPGSRALTPTGDCNDAANAMARWFNDLLRIELSGAAVSPKGPMPELNYSIAGNYEILSEMTASPLVAGIREARTACCGVGRFMAEDMCAQPDTTASTTRGAFRDRVEFEQCRAGSCLSFWQSESVADA
ncbi:hypothetical protein BRADI_1g30034v3 [Brachypodium distachyon]|uniref:GDSL esterase/lipase n=1 Tax=Brachypodium distachyon TaxID=15368 RepID=A0A0Q3L013_BRADI|nr:hypothetical protein BRADI_1g30034v3 [Brachypodium distachyon]